MTSPASHAELASRTRHAVMRLARLLRQQGDADVTPSQMSALFVVERIGPVTLGDLAARERVQPPSMTRTVAALEEAGLLERETDPDDRRVSRVTLTAAGRKAVERSRSRKTAFLAARLRDLPPEDLAAVEAAVGVIERILEEDP